MKPRTTTIAVGVGATLILLAATGVLRVKKRVDKAKAMLHRFGPLDQLTPEKIGSVGTVLVIEKLLQGLTGASDEVLKKNEVIAKIMNEISTSSPDETRAHLASDSIHGQVGNLVGGSGI